jgi:hypothetical protein
MIAGGNTSLRLDAYSHLFGGEIEFAAFVKTMSANLSGHRFCKSCAWKQLLPKNMRCILNHEQPA